MSSTFYEDDVGVAKKQKLQPKNQFCKRSSQPLRNVVNFGEQFFIDARMLGEQVKRPCQRMRSRFMAGEQQSHHLIAYLRVADRLAGIVARVQQHA